MTGSVLAAVIIPIVVVIALAAWLAMVYYADAHPGRPGRDAVADRSIADEAASDRTRHQNERRVTTSSGSEEASWGQDAAQPGDRAAGPPDADRSPR